MTLMQLVKPAGAVATVALLCFAGLSVTSPRVRAETNSSVQLGFDIAPVKLNLNGLNPALVGKGSYIVNAKGDCNGCHVSPDLSPADPNGFVPGRDPYLLPFTPPAKVNPASYLGGGATFGPFPGEGIGGKGPLVIYSRNLTPGCDKAPCSNPLPEGGHTLEEFQRIIRTGHDFDQAHPACSTGKLGAEGCILSPPFNADLLQVMPWPTYANMSDDDIRAVYEYLRAIPCISHKGTVGLPANLYQVCP